MQGHKSQSLCIGHANELIRGRLDYDELSDALEIDCDTPNWPPPKKNTADTRIASYLNLLS